MADPFPTDPEGAVVALVLAGGTGGRLMPLTAARAKPMVPLAGQYRLIDVVLSNLAHSRLRDVWVVEQYRPFTLNQHLAGGRPWDLDGTRHGLRVLPPAQGRDEEGFAQGNGHAIHQQLAPLRRFGAKTVVIMSADHLSDLGHIRPWRHIERRKSRQIMVGSVPVGGDAPISVQSMTNTPTTDAAAVRWSVPWAAAAVRWRPGRGHHGPVRCDGTGVLPPPGRDPAIRPPQSGRADRRRAAEGLSSATVDASRAPVRIESASRPGLTRRQDH